LLTPAEAGALAGVGVAGVGVPGAVTGAAASFTADNFPRAEIFTICPDCISTPLLPSPVGTKITLPSRHVTVTDPSAARSIFDVACSPSDAPTTVYPSIRVLNPCVPRCELITTVPACSSAAYCSPPLNAIWLPAKI